MRFDECTPIQERCIPEILAGHDMLGIAQTGTGKTAAYLLPILSLLDEGNYPKDAINCIIMSPTRELAQQIDQAMQGFGYYLGDISSLAVYGGNDGQRYSQETKSLKLGADVIIATPGRLISHMQLGNVDMSRVSFFVLDEADRMLDMGFSEDILSIAKQLPQNCQTIMFSATMPQKIEQLAKSLLKNPVEVKLAVSKPAEKIHQMAYICHETQKLGIIKDIFKNADLKRVIIFCGSKMKVKQVAGALQRMKIKCGEMHSDLEQSERDDMMFKFKSGQYDVIVATDILARGIDIDDISMVINYDVPHDAEDYVHRIGRTARAERDGQAVTLVSDDDMVYFRQIEQFLGKEVEKLPLPEGLGEAPEYRRASAKSRRRKDRDHQSHKDKKERNNRSNRQAKEQPQNGGQPRDEKQNNRRRRNGAQEQGNAKVQKQDEARQDDNRKQGKGRGRNQEKAQNRNQEKARNASQPKAQSRNQNKNQGKGNAKEETANAARKPKNRKGNNRRKTQNNKEFHSTKYEIRDDMKLPEKKESGFKKLIKKPLKWLHSLGKK